MKLVPIWNCKIIMRLLGLHTLSLLLVMQMGWEGGSVMKNYLRGLPGVFLGGYQAVWWEMLDEHVAYKTYRAGARAQQALFRWEVEDVKNFHTQACDQPYPLDNLLLCIFTEDTMIFHQFLVFLDICIGRVNCSWDYCRFFSPCRIAIHIVQRHWAKIIKIRLPEVEQNNLGIRT